MSNTITQVNYLQQLKLLSGSEQSDSNIDFAVYETLTYNLFQPKNKKRSMWNLYKTGVHVTWRAGCTDQIPERHFIIKWVTGTA